MIKQPVLDMVHKFFPSVVIAFKDQSLFMKILGKILFFNKSFMTNYITTIGETIYYPSANYVNGHPASAFIVLLHELVHVRDEKTVGKTIFDALYLLPQILAFLAIPLFFVIGFWSLLFLLFAAPLPAYFRMNYEKRAYLASLYVMKKLNDKCQYNIDLNDKKQYFLQQFKSSSYYFMWPFSNLDAQFTAALTKINNNERPYDDMIFDILDQIIAVY